MVLSRITKLQKIKSIFMQLYRALQKKSRKEESTLYRVAKLILYKVFPLKSAMFNMNFQSIEKND